MCHRHILLYLAVAEVPLGVIAVEVIDSECRRGVACGVEAVLGVGPLHAWDGLWHDAVGAIRELFDAP